MPSLSSLRFSVLAVLAALGTCVLAGCGDDEPSSISIVGTYAVSSHTLADGDCGNPQPVAASADCFLCAVEKPFFKLKVQSLFGQRYVRLVECDSASVCDDDGEEPDTIHFGGTQFDHQVDGLWTGELHAASGFDTSCTYSYGLSQVEELEGGVRITITRSTSSPTVANSDECLALAENPPPRDTLTCGSVEVLEGTPSTP